MAFKFEERLGKGPTGRQRFGEMYRNTQNRLSSTRSDFF